MPPVAVLRVITTLEPEVGGPSYSAVSAAIAEQRHGVQTTIVSTRPHGTAHTDHEGLKACGVHQVTRPRVRWRPALAQRWALSPSFLWWIVRNARRYGVIHVHYVWPAGAIVATMVARIAGIPVVMTPHESLTEFDIVHSRSSLRRRQKQIVRRALLRRVDRVIVASQLERRGSGLDADPRAVVLPHAVPMAAVRRRRRAAGSPLVVGYLGRLHEKKRIDLVLEAVGATQPQTRLLVAGAPPSGALDSLRGAAARLGIAGVTDFLGFVSPERRDAFFDQIDVLVMPSTYECFGMAAAESLAAGVPAIVTQDTGIGEIIREHGGGTVVAHDDPAAIAAALNRLHADPAEAAKQGEEARAAAEQALSYDRYGAAISEVYRAVRAGGSATTAR